MEKITTYNITNNQGDSLTIANFGARLVSWHTEINDEVRNIVLGYKNLDDYFTDPSYLGAIAGPYANRIANASCNIAGKTIKLAANEGLNQLHGGDKGLANQFWQCHHHSENTLTLTCQLKDGFNGYPGDINVKVIYEISPESELKITINVDSEKVTIVGPTAHPYFNLNSEQKSTEHSLQVYGEHYTPLNNKGIPIGEIKSVEGTDYDFRVPKKVSCASNTKPLDDNFLISLTDTTTEQTQFKHASLTSEDQKLTLHASSNYPAIQVYTGEHLNAPFVQHQGVCMEPQFSPDSPNQPSFPFHCTSPSEPLSTVICYKLQR